MTTNSTSPPDPPNLRDLLNRVSRSWTARLLAVLLLGAELLNYGMLPAILKTVEANIAAAKATTEEAKAQVAKMRERGLADLAAEDARVKAGQALQADRFHKAEARRADNMARVLREKATNSPELLKAETEIKRQTALINDEKAIHEARRARAEADETAAQAQIADLKERLRLATVRAEVISQRFTALSECAGAIVAGNPDVIIGLGQDDAGFGNRRASNASERFFRSRCLSQIR